ncbi:MAG: dTDP-4-dehydrorhamnose reductase [Bacteroidales bacterium]|nr:dTDP-4-dehydrorhamnose reductase [Bacteroidales bacterium]
MINVLVTGSYGQLGNEIKKLADQYPDFNFYFTDIDTLNLTDENAVSGWFQNNKPEVCLNCAAYTAVDKAEEERDLALLVNKTAVANLAKNCKCHNTLLIHVSTDYVFNGENFKPYVETDETAPISYYGFTKLEGEVAVRQFAGRALIVRTSWLYSVHGNNFVKTMIRLGRERDTLNVVFDQIGTPTFAGDLALVLLELAAKYKDLHVMDLFHYSNEGVISWYDFAKAIMEEAGLSCEVKAIESKDFPTKTKRPFYSVLNKEKIKNNLSMEVPYWRDSLRKMMIELD